MNRRNQAIEIWLHFFGELKRLFNFGKKSMLNGNFNLHSKLFVEKISGSKSKEEFLMLKAISTGATTLALMRCKEFLEQKFAKMKY